MFSNPESQTGEWKGAGAHTKFSTKKMREDNGIIEIEVMTAAVADLSPDNLLTVAGY